MIVLATDLLHFDSTIDQESSKSTDTLAMSQSWLRRLGVTVADTLYGSLLYIPLGVMFLSRSLAGTSTYIWDETQIPDLSGKVAIVTGGK